MATSDRHRRGPGRTGAGGRVLGYLGSTRNITGCVLALTGLAAHFLGLAGTLWPLVVAGLYGAGALLAPPEPARAAVSLAGAGPGALRTELDALRRRVAGSGLPADVAARVEGLTGLLEGMLGRAEALAASPDHLHVVSQTIRDYLPASLDAYAALPRSYAMERRDGDGRSPHEELLDQLDLLDGGLREIARAVHRGDEQALRDQGRFLRDRFGRSELDL
ncbi:hypothetical protein ACFOWE_17615 [Planomonospora corallina]|uniref:5-bromo-4-chloroindolyl phosphate hydrolysis protein n=1 Tax=Planomonospora corallina TaxID=1806052 RepID=A0ABV8I7K3_9ACTN